MARLAASALVALLSLMKRTPADIATSGCRCGRPGRSQYPPRSRPGPPSARAPSRVAAEAFCALCSPGSALVCSSENPCPKLEPRGRAARPANAPSCATAHRQCRSRRCNAHPGAQKSAAWRRHSPPCRHGDPDGRAKGSASPPHQSGAWRFAPTYSWTFPAHKRRNPATAAATAPPGQIRPRRIRNPRQCPEYAPAARWWWICRWCR